MRNPLTRVLVTLAATDISPSELHRFLRWVDLLGRDEVIRRIENIRNDLRKYDDLAEGVPKQIGSRDSDYTTQEVSQRVARLLLSGTGLNKTEAAGLVLRGIEAELGRPIKDFPAYNKMSLDEWLKKISNRIAPNDLLRIASLIRNNKVHGLGIDWPLRPDDDEKRNP
jgi:hypothetical protein